MSGNFIAQVPSISYTSMKDQSPSSQKREPKMLYKQLGRTGLKFRNCVLVQCLSAVMRNEEQSARMFNASLDAGINFFDCADGYSKGAAETILGKLMREKRDELVITSKCFLPLSNE